MLHYSIIPIENILYNNNTDSIVTTKYIDYKGCKIEAIYSDGVTKINRVISTSPSDYLNMNLLPGTVIDNNY